MANLQYIGARYVPKIYKNSQDPSSCAWEENTAYEALELVIYNSVNYISRKPVPASVGNPYSNTDYWCSCGSVNAQVAQYMGIVAQLAQDIDDEETASRAYTDQEVAGGLSDAKDYTDGKISDVNDDISSLDSRVDALEAGSERTPKLLLVGDSWAAGSGGISGKGWTYYFEAYTGIDCEAIEQNGGGFYDVGNANADFPGVNFQGAITAKFNGSTEAERAAYTGVIYVGGINDKVESYTTVSNAVVNCLNYVKSLLPNAKQIVIPTRGTAGPSTYRERHTFQAWQDGAGAAGIFAASHSLYWFYGRSTLEGSSADGYHLNDDGYKLCAKYIEAVYKGCDYAYIPFSGGQVYPEAEPGETVATGHVNVGRTADGVVTCSGKFTLPARAVTASDTLCDNIGSEFCPVGTVFVPAVFYADDTSNTRIPCIVTISSAGVMAARGKYSDYGTDGGTLYINASWQVDVPQP